MTTTRRIFTDEFKQEAVALLARSGRSLAQIARELGVHPVDGVVQSVLALVIEHHPNRALTDFRAVFG